MNLLVSTKNILSTIKCSRIQKGYSQEYMAYLLQISQSTYNKLENGKMKMGVHEMITILNTLGIRLEITPQPQE